MRTVSNLRRRRLGSATALVAPIVVGSLCLVGVVAPPAVSLQSARSSNARLCTEVEHLEECSRELAEIQEDGGDERILAAIERLEALVPREIPDIELQGLVRTSADLAGVHLDSLSLGPLVDVGLPSIRNDFIAARSVRVGARTDPAKLVEFVERPRSLGIPASVVDFSLVRSTGADATFLVEATLAIFEHTSPPSGSSAEAESPDA